MAALRSISLSHFRSHAAFALEVDDRPVALYGPNGAGKTNILEAISMLSPGRGLRRAAADELARRPDPIGWKVRARVETPSGAHEVATGALPGQRRSVEIDGKTAPQAALGALLPMLWLTPAMDRLWTEGPSERRRFLDRATLSFEPGHGERTLAYEHAMRERNRLFAEGRRDPAWIDALEARMAKAGAGIARARVETVARLIAAQDDAASAFPRAGLRIEGATEARVAAADDPRAAEDEAETALRMALAAGRAADASAGRALQGPHRSDLIATHDGKGVEARLASTGEQKALLISIILADARALAAERGASPVLLLDEIAAHLDADRRAALFDEIVALGAPAFMTGTGAELFEALGARGQIIHVGAG
ncbi:DNA replication/repair protein RecF [Pikeienuella piscinae]|uniref:DNA replication and repair protein RecF n=1 Tax=Pikeienuella piscinae TaxID=2748098 RepID=A0A7L5BSW2_9RHOB|nr:DNA replication/repair protein RecF [Pikeienuella piscinae]QIE54142.1 DNA replication/repair protein RecF [Pikeienuella piscinae]